MMILLAVGDADRPLGRPGVKVEFMTLMLQLERATLKSWERDFAQGGQGGAAMSRCPAGGVREWLNPYRISPV
jgi:hypothetical protein